MRGRGNTSSHVIDAWPGVRARDRMGADPAAPRAGISWISASRRTSLYSALGWAKEFTVHLLPLVPPVVASGLSVSKHSSGCVATLLCVIRCLTDEPPGPAARNDTVTARLRSSPDRSSCSSSRSSGARAPTLALYVLMTKAIFLQTRARGARVLLVSSRHDRRGGGQEIRAPLV